MVKRSLGRHGHWRASAFCRTLTDETGREAERGHFRRLLLPGESLLMAWPRSDKIHEAVNLIREMAGKPAIFVLRSAPDRSATPSCALPPDANAGERLVEVASRLAAEDRLSPAGAFGRSCILPHLERSRRELEAIRRDLALADQVDGTLVHGAEWLLDNAYLIQGQAAEAQHDLPRNYYDRLPTLARGPLAGLPRAYRLALEYLAQTGGRLETRSLQEFLRAYQQAQPLQTGELWALPSLLRLRLVENLRDLSLQIRERQSQLVLADLWANRLLNASRRGPDQLLFFLAELAREIHQPSPHFAVSLAGHLADESAASLALRGWLERKLDCPLAEIIQAEQRRQSAEQMLVAGAVNSLRLLARLPWQEFFETVSPVETVLRSDPSGVYPAMDAATRDRYHHEIEDLAAWSGHTEVETAREAVGLSAAGAPGDKCRHVGYFLIGQGRADLEDRLEAKRPWPVRRRRWLQRRAASVYLASVSALSLAGLVLFLSLSHLPGFDSWPLLILGLLSFIPLSELAVQLVNASLVRLLPPARLPKLSFAHGIPDDCRTLVVVPMMLLTPASIQGEIDRLEIRSLANPGSNLLFALLADFADAPAQNQPGDEHLLGIAAAGIERLDVLHGPDRFFLFYRRRSWSQSEQSWIGWERKRGKLEELNRFLVTGGESGGAELGVICRIGRHEPLAGVRFIITLDSDTELPRDAARRLAATLAHPLNRPEISPEGRMTGGHGLIQPRVSVNLPSAIGSGFARLFAGAAGLDPYSRPVSDLYQDLTGEGTFYGKGIYDLRAFHAVLDRRFPTDTVLSHDLLEGAYLRTALASDIELLDLYPQSYQAFARRQHRWIRGDWQIAPWIWPSIPPHRGRKTRNPLTILNRWRILDNLRRSLIWPSGFGLLLAAWLLSPLPWVSSVLIGLILLSPVLLPFLSGNNPSWMELRPGFLRAFCLGALIPHQAWLAGDAIVRALYRRWFSHRRLLAWETAQSAELRWRSAPHAATLRPGAATALLALASGYALRLWQPESWPIALPYLGLWLTAPLVLWFLNAPARTPAPGLPDRRDRLALRLDARRTWRYFDDFVNAYGHWLPPDNYQEAPREEVAWRTSPTNIGMWLLSALAASDLGYLTAPDLQQRLKASLQVLQGLEKHEGHLLNWYDLRTLEPLRPRYVSTVDSGNLLACLWTLDQGCRELSSRPVLPPGAQEGLSDAVRLLHLAWGASGSPAESLRLALADTSPGLAAYLARLRSAATGASQAAGGFSAKTAERAEAAYWITRLKQESSAWLTVIDTYLAWVDLLAGTPPLPGSPGEIFRNVRRRILRACPTWSELAQGLPGLSRLLSSLLEKGSELPPPVRVHLARLAEALRRSSRAAQEFLADWERLRAAYEDLAGGMKMRFLYEPERRLFSIGYDANEHRLDQSFYDLLASEARLASFVAIARGEVPAEHWLALGRCYGRARGRPVLLSWNGTAFEYLMPLLLTRSLPSSQLDAAARAAVAVQIAYARKRGLPWGISEAAFSDIDAHGIYQYRAFGVPWLGLKRGLQEDLVVAPYATALALPIDPPAALRNLRRLARAGLRGRYGYYESIDFSRQRSPSGERGVIVYAYMAHHQGMSLLAMTNLLTGGLMQDRFHADPRVRATEPFLYERAPMAPPVTPAPMGEAPAPRLQPIPTLPMAGRLTTAFTPVPRAHLLSNGRFHLMGTNAGGGYTRWREFDVTRWRADTTRDQWGEFIYLQDEERHALWSAAWHPVGRNPRRYAVNFAADRITYRRRDYGIETLSEIAVSPEDDAGARCLTLFNRSSQPRHLILTTYSELALAEHGADRAHPAFSKMFVQTGAWPEINALYAWRRSRDAGEPAIWTGQVLALEDPLSGPVEYETDRRLFLGRNRSPRHPVALARPLSGSAGTVLDPIFSLRIRLTLEPGQRARLALVTAVAETREALRALLEKYQHHPSALALLDLAWDQAQLELRHLGLPPEEARYCQELGSHLLYPNHRLRPPADRLRRNNLGQAGLWAHGISGDLPILLIMVDNDRDLGMVRQALVAQAYLRAKGLRFDLVILNGECASYSCPLQEALSRLIQANPFSPPDQPGGVFLRAANLLPEEEVTLLMAAARVMLPAARGSLSQQLGAPPPAAPLPPWRKERRYLSGTDPVRPLPAPELAFANGWGGFADGGREFVIDLPPGASTPAPWINVMANPLFGALVTESGSGSAWYANSQAYRLLPWSNDPVADPAAAVIYLRDEDDGALWSPTPQPLPGQGPYRVRHGAGYTMHEHDSQGFRQELLTFVPLDGSGGDPVRIQRLVLRNHSGRRRRLTATAYAELVLGGNREETVPHIDTRYDADLRALVARNAYHSDFSTMIAFAVLSPAADSYTADRTEFMGRNGSPANPAALDRQFLSGRAGAGHDACAALQTHLILEPDESATVLFLLGAAEEREHVRRLVLTYQDPFRVEEAFAATRSWWDTLLGAVQVKSPDQAADLLVNRWLLYQTLSCRIWARSAFYQSGGAYGFRDQLQDALAFLQTRPEIAREQILRAAGRQFPEGDVQHWWHPPSGGGTRTRCSDDLLWLVYAVTQYVEATGDHGLLEERQPFLEGRTLEEGEQEAYFTPTVSLESATVFEHCRRALARGTTSGPHGLPLIGSGDWNDGLNRAGNGGRGESVWLACFLLTVLRDFAALCETLDQPDRAAEYCRQAAELAERIEAQAWDGAWYRRAYTDAGTPLGSRANREMMIDSLPQSWAVISGAAAPERAVQALASADEALVRMADRLVLLFTPPFDQGKLDPGYIQGYPPGLRENGGQYTHAAVWLAIAHARLGNGARAVEILTMLNPIEHAATPADAARYQVEPYAVAADIYAHPGREGQGGWTWYTGSSAWLYRAWIEEIFGCKRRGRVLVIDPCIPPDWPGFEISYAYRSGRYEIKCVNGGAGQGVAWIEVDGERIEEKEIELREDGARHEVRVVLESAPEASPADLTGFAKI